MAPRTKPAPTSNGWAGTAGEWKQRAGPHDIALPSGMTVTVKLIGLATLARLDALPDDLNEAVLLHLANHDRGGLPAVIGDEMLNAARGDEKASERASDLTRSLGNLTRELVLAALVDPKLTFDELDDVPESDLEFLMRVVSGRQPFDAAGRRIGVEPLEPWATFRDAHQCGESCDACLQAQRELSSVHVGDV